LKKRLDVILHEQGFAESRAKAQAIIMAGLVWSGDKRLDKAGEQCAEDIALEVRGQSMKWVSRGGLKLEHALEVFKTPIHNKICLDIGASTGGFSDVLLSMGAEKVYAVDVGYGQLHEKIRSNDKVVILEKTNARYLDASTIPEPPQVVVCDASFISLKKILPASLALASNDAELLALIKPQFEVEKGQVGKGGVVRDEALRNQICQGITEWLNDEMKWVVKGITASPILGPKGNKEFIICASRNAL
jgi:23S rRNA (cytidine1920-2'-O)/16S rRNA (cytidine1409-2'-O)-methyltransferase